MNRNLITTLAALGAVAVLASPVLAKTPERHHSAAPAIANVPAEQQPMVVEPYGLYGPAQTVYAPNLHLPARPYQSGGVNPDFQLSHP
jgi:hypothetical protein